MTAANGGQRLERRILAEARRLGFDLAGISRAHQVEHLAAYRSWLASGYHGEMKYLSRPDRVARREELGLILPGVSSIVSVALNYYPGDAPEVTDSTPARGLIARYARGADYHEVMLGPLEELGGFIGAAAGCTVEYRAYVDTGPLLERDHAAECGLGFVGKNTCLIIPRLGSYVFLGELLLDIELEPTGNPAMPSCGSCRRCLDSCPTGALVAPHVLDARRCISYLTIELRGAIPRQLRPLVGNRIYGCDVCQEVCPWQRFARKTSEESFIPSDAEQASPLLAPLLGLDEQAFDRRFDGTPLERTGRSRILRNVAIALGNSEGSGGMAALIAALNDSDPLIRSHAAWALGRKGGERAAAALGAAIAGEKDKEAREEIGHALQESVR
jgi:epoxyqueuosine reductase